jgi:hypothetical protein
VREKRRTHDAVENPASQSTTPNDTPFPV